MLTNKEKEYQKRIIDAVGIGTRYGYHGDGPQKQWVIDQMIRILAADRYEDVVPLPVEKLNKGKPPWSKED